ncbi:MAG: DUF2188 domain-containing protein [Betaproteobacteria bacterium]|nr:DUF2188 domain-containing protein [Betaproteobacteria bacterium]
MWRYRRLSPARRGGTGAGHGRGGRGPERLASRSSERTHRGEPGGTPGRTAPGGPPPRRAAPDGTQRADSLHDRKADAVSRGRDLARNKQTELVIKNADGRIASKDSYGNDPRNTKGRSSGTDSQTDVKSRRY